VADSVLSSILTAIKLDITTLGLTYGTPPVALPVNLRKLPTAINEKLSPLPQVIVCPAERGEKSSFAGEGRVFKEYPIQVVIFAAGNADPVSNLTTLTNWRESICRLFQGVNGSNLRAVSGVWKCVTEFQGFLDRQAWSKLYDLVAIQARVYTLEPASLPA
jgi:hypothetical protein